ncbi:MAG: response regulator, partial [Lachnospiraceae bacterium]|nr:response regulator [Lachnospiraceae bacterium]
MKLFKKVTWLIIAIQIALGIYVAVSFQVDDLTLAKGDIVSFNTGWMLYREDGTSVEIESLPYAGTSKAHETIALENTIPKEFAGLTMKLPTEAKQLKVFVDGNEIYQFGTQDVKRFGYTPGDAVNFIDIPRELGEGKIRLEMTAPYINIAAHVDSIEVGARDVVILRFIETQIPDMALNMIILFSAFVLVAVRLISVAVEGGTGGLEHLVRFFLAVFVFFTIKTNVLMTIYGNQTLYFYITYLCLMIMPILLQLYFAESAQGIHKKISNALIILSLFSALIQIVLQVFDIADFRYTAIFSNLLLFMSGLSGTLIYAGRLKKEGTKDREAVLTVIAIAFSNVCFVADWIRIFAADNSVFVEYGRIGYTVFGMIMANVHAMKISRRYAANAEKAAARLQREKEKVEEQNKMLLLAREEAEAARQAAQDASHAKSSFLANVSHEIRTPINAILGMDTMILRESHEDNIREYAGDIRSAGQNLLSLINDILDFSKIESGKMEIKPFDYELITLLGNCYNMIQMRAKEKGLFFRMENSTTIPHRLHGDEVRIRQIVINFLTNAVKYTEKGEVVLSVNWEKISDDRIKLILSVRDTGMGIKYEDQQSLFTSFQRFDLERNRNIEGTGLGLAITKQLVELMDGTINVKSSYGRGSTFTVEIPQIVRSFNPIGEFEIHTQGNTAYEKEYQSDFTAPDAQILVVDDVSMNLKVIRELLKSTKIQIDTVESGKECLRNITFKKYDIIFLDHMMPDMDGMETLKNMKWVADNKNSDTPVIMLTANAVVGAKDEYFNAGFDDYLAKPIKENELEKMIRKYLPKELVIASEDAETEEVVSENIGSDKTISKDAVIHDKVEEQRKKEVLVPPQKQPADNRSIMEKLDFLDARAGLGYCAGSEGIYT